MEKIERNCMNCDYEEDCRKKPDEKRESEHGKFFCVSWKPDANTKKQLDIEAETRIQIFDRMVRKYVPEELRDWLIHEGFFSKPASIHHHGRYEGALFDHSFAVANILKDMTEKMEIKWQQERSPYIVGMFHDLCKMDNYQKSGDEKWEYNNATLLPGHGEKSVIMLQQHMKLTDEEMLCIRWHMGAFDDKENWNSYGRSVTTYQTVLWTHCADMYAARVLGI